MSFQGFGGPKMQPVPVPVWVQDQATQPCRIVRKGTTGMLMRWFM